MTIPKLTAAARPSIVEFMQGMIRPGAQVDTNLSADMAMHAANQALEAIDRVVATVPGETERLLVILGAFTIVEAQRKNLTETMDRAMQGRQS